MEEEILNHNQKVANIESAHLSDPNNEELLNLIWLCVHSLVSSIHAPVFFNVLSDFRSVKKTLIPNF
jgi:hypothetical protein